MNLETAPREQLVKIILQLREQILLLQGENKLLKQELKKLQGKIPQNPPFHIKPGIKKKPKGKRRKRTSNFARKRERATHIVRHAYSRCPDCGETLYQGWLKSRRQVIDIPLTPATITEHQIFAHWCSHCQREIFPGLDLANQVLGNHRVSLKLMSFIATLRGEERKPISEIQAHLERFYGLHLSQGEIVEICHTVSQEGLPVYDNLEEKVRLSPVVHADETGWRQDGRNGYLWTFATPKIKYLTYRHSRGKQIVNEVIGEEFEGVLVSDFYAAYNTHLGFHQRCWVHLLRDIKKLQEALPDHQKLKRWAQAVIDLYQEAKIYPGPDPGKYPHPRSQQQQRWRDQAYFRDRLLELCRSYLTQDVPMRTLCQRIDKYQDELFLFIADPQVPADNNAAERALRHSVIARKISGGTRSAKGSRTRFILASLFGTWKLQNKNPFQECLNLLTATSTGQPAFETLSKV